MCCAGIRNGGIAHQALVGNGKTFLSSEMLEYKMGNYVYRRWDIISMGDSLQ